MNVITKPKQKEDIRPQKKIRKYGYEYTLVECDRDNYRSGVMGVKGYVLKSVRKLGKDE